MRHFATLFLSVACATQHEKCKRHPSVRSLLANGESAPAISIKTESNWNACAFCLFTRAQRLSKHCSLHTLIPNSGSSCIFYLCTTTMLGSDMYQFSVFPGISIFVILYPRLILCLAHLWAHIWYVAVCAYTHTHIFLYCSFDSRSIVHCVIWLVNFAVTTWTENLFLVFCF